MSLPLTATRPSGLLPRVAATSCHAMPWLTTAGFLNNLATAKALPLPAKHVAATVGGVPLGTPTDGSKKREGRRHRSKGLSRPALRTHLPIVGGSWKAWPSAGDSDRGVPLVNSLA
jgi:hypothetical protein